MKKIFQLRSTINFEPKLYLSNLILYFNKIENLPFISQKKSY